MVAATEPEGEDIEVVEEDLEVVEEVTEEAEVSGAVAVVDLEGEEEITLTFRVHKLDQMTFGLK